MNSARFRLESVEPFIPTAASTTSSTPNMDDHDHGMAMAKKSPPMTTMMMMSMLTMIKRHYILSICPTRTHDSGWYSCTLVKRHVNEPSVKYYTYLDVRAMPTNRSSHENHSNEDAEDQFEGGDDEEDEDDYEIDFEQLCRDKEIVHDTTTHLESDPAINTSSNQRIVDVYAVEDDSKST